MGPLPKSEQGNTHSIVIIDHFTKWAQIHPMKETKATDVANLLLKTICLYGIPDQIITDQGTNFQAEMLNELYELLDIHITVSPTV